MEPQIGTSVHFVLEKGPNAGRCRAALIKAWLVRGGRVAAILHALPCRMDDDPLYQEGTEIAAVQSSAPVPGRWHLMAGCPQGLPTTPPAPEPVPTKVDK